MSTAARIEQLYRQAELVSRAAAARYNIVEATISDMQRAMSSGRISSEELVALHLVRIAQYDGKINAIIAVNPSALDVARALDRERAAGKVRGPLHGVPIALKDIINTSDLPTTGGALAFAGITPPYDATLTASLRAAGAVIIAKTQLTELANWVTVGMPNNYNGFNGYGMNPYDPRTDPRTGNDANGYPFNDGRPVMNTGGSSSGTGTAASFWAANVGTETSGSILSPSNQTMLVGIKPTVGRISRYGIMPITADQDTAGPMARTVSDAALLMGALESNTPDPNDAATRRCVAPPGRDYTRFLRLAGLRGARIGIPRANFYAPVGRPDGATVGGLTAEQTAVMNEAIEVLKAQGAVIVDPADIPSVVDGTADNNFLLWGICASAAQGKGGDAACSVDFKYGMKRDFNLYLNSLGPTRAFKTLTDLRTYNSANVPRGAIKYGQVLLDISDQMDLVADLARYQADRAKDLRLSDTHGIGEAMQRNNLDALLFPGASSANIAARAGFPTVIVPFGTIPNPAGASSVAVNAANPALPAGFNPLPQPYGVGFTSTACNEPRLIELAYAFEQATKRRVPPPNMP
ncbi:MAG: amidase family protein [Vicinamibacterales bacterium]